MATYLLNILPNKKLKYQSPLKIGCLCYPLFPSTTINKLQSRSTPCVFLGYPSNHRGYKCYDISLNKIIVCRHVIFDESEFPFSKLHTLNPTNYQFLDNEVSPYINHLITQTNQSPRTPNIPQQNSQPPAQLGSALTSPTFRPQPQPNQTHRTEISTSNQPTSQPTQNLPSTSTPPNIPLPAIYQSTVSSDNKPATRSHHGNFKPNQKYINLHTEVTKSPLPRNPVLALKDPNWKMAMDDEYNALIQNKTWDLVPRPPDANVIHSIWIFRHKEKSDVSFERHKARLVGNGAGQQVDIDCGETFSPVVKPATIRTILSISLSKAWQIHQLDVKNAFLHGELKETVYMHQPLGFKDPNLPHHVYRLQKSLYGLKQAPRAWYKRFTDYVYSIGFSQSKSDNSLFIYRKDTHLAYLLLYVDNIILTASSDDLPKSIISRLSSEFAMKGLGPLSYFLGIAVTRHDGGLFLSQKKYADEILERAGMSSCKSCPTPVDTKPKLSAKTSTPYEDPSLYHSLAGALQYPTLSRPDITYAVQQICLFMHDPIDDQMHSLSRILRYI